MQNNNELTPHHRSPTRILVVQIQAVLIHLLAVLILFSAANARAVDVKTAVEEDLEIYFPYEDRVAGWVDNTARAIDAFFGNDDAWRTDNQSWLRVTTDARWDSLEQGKIDLSPRLRLDLPTAKKELRLLIENDVPEERSAAEDAIPAIRQTNEERSPSIGLGLDLNKDAKAWDKQFQIGVRGSLPLNPYSRFIAKRTWQLAGDWRLDSYNRVAWFNSDGYSAKSQIRFGQPLAPDWYLNFTTNLNWQEKDDYLQFSETVNFANVLSNRSAINYSAGINASHGSDPQFDSFFLLADYRRNVSRRLIFVDVIPVLWFPREEDYNPQWGITLRLELYFQKGISRHK